MFTKIKFKKKKRCKCWFTFPPPAPDIFLKCCHTVTTFTFHFTWLSWRSLSQNFNLNILTLICPPSHFPHLPAETVPPSVLHVSHWHLLSLLFAAKICAVNTVWHFLTFHELITLQIIKHVHICNKRRQNGCQQLWLMTSLRLYLMRFFPTIGRTWMPLCLQ